jgi:hypothetical protein
VFVDPITRGLPRSGLNVLKAPLKPTKVLRPLGA